MDIVAVVVSVMVSPSVSGGLVASATRRTLERAGSSDHLAGLGMFRPPVVEDDLERSVSLITNTHGARPSADSAFHLCRDSALSPYA